MGESSPSSCRWAAFQAEEAHDSHLVDLPPSEQVARGKELLQMLQEPLCLDGAVSPVPREPPLLPSRLPPQQQRQQQQHLQQGQQVPQAILRHGSRDVLPPPPTEMPPPPPGFEVSTFSRTGNDWATQASHVQLRPATAAVAANAPAGPPPPPAMAPGVMQVWGSAGSASLGIALCPSVSGSSNSSSSSSSNTSGARNPYAVASGADMSMPLGVWSTPCFASAAPQATSMSAAPAVAGSAVVAVTTQADTPYQFRNQLRAEAAPYVPMASVQVGVQAC